jgi:hypothetical protein
MTPKEKSEELVDNFYNVIGKNYSKGDGFGTQLFEEAKQCALIAVDEVIESYKTKDLIYPKEIIYYQEVKQEIEKL